jgi:hypothetical protein
LPSRILALPGSTINSAPTPERCVLGAARPCFFDYHKGALPNYT